MRNRGNIYAGCRSDEQMYVVMIMVKPMDEHRHIGRMGAVDQVISYIRAAIQSGQYVVGDKLPNEAILAETIGVGRSSLREGMRILAAYGLWRSGRERAPSSPIKLRNSFLKLSATCRMPIFIVLLSCAG